ncbi:isoprenyl transferase [Rhodobacteraceae bacterium NNCM2]|nr:isoprenyl transferase [Coraliihabitans acroporae]
MKALDLTGKAGPKHVAIIMDGNGRWAQRFGRPRTFGHQRGVERVREIVRAAPDLGVKALTLFAFSTENWKRPGYEVKVLMSLLRRYIVREVEELDGMNVRVRFIGDRERLPDDLQRLMAQMEERTASNDRLDLQIAISYGSRHEITSAVRDLAARAARGEISPDEIDQDMISDALFTRGIDDPDLVIRTSGEMRISNFLLWQIAYAEFAFVDECWPDFTVEHLTSVVANFGRRERRFGKVSAQL